MKSILAISPLLGSFVLAHPGHDHSAASAPLLHALWIAPIAVAVLGVVYLLHKKFSK